MPPILFGMTWNDSVQLDSKSHPPNRKSAQAKKSAACEWSSIIGKDGIGHSILFESRFKRGQGAGAFRILERLTSDDIATEVIADSQWVTVSMIAQLKLALEIDTPDLIGSGACRQWSLKKARCVPASALPSVADQVISIENLVNRKARWDFEIRILAHQPLSDLSSAPCRPVLFRA
jgi:hypothetical protein